MGSLRVITLLCLVGLVSTADFPSGGANSSGGGDFGGGADGTGGGDFGGGHGLDADDQTGAAGDTVSTSAPDPPGLPPYAPGCSPPGFTFGEFDTSGSDASGSNRRLSADTSGSGSGGPTVGFPEGQKHTGFQVAMTFPVMSLLIGCLSKRLLDYWNSLCPNIPMLPYTPFLLVVGIIMKCFDEYTSTYLHIAKSIEQWENMDGHLLLFLYLPPLVFGDAMFLNFRTVVKCWPQCALLAFPGVALGAALFMALTAMFPRAWSCQEDPCTGLEVCDDAHGWQNSDGKPNWELGLAFGSVMSATDPVAVVSILNSLGAPPTLTMIIGGESLLNDGAAMVLWTICFELYKNQSDEVFSGGIFPVFLMLFFGSMVIGLIFGALWRYWLGTHSSSLDHTNGVTQTVLTIAGSYFCFYVAEGIFSASGVMAVVFMGGTLSATFWPVVADRGLLTGVWHSLEWMMNTILFLHAGLVIGKEFIQAPVLEFNQCHNDAQKELVEKGYGPIKDKTGFVPDRKLTSRKSASDMDGPLEKATA